MKSYKTMRKEGKGFFKIISYIVISAFIISIFLIGSLTDMLGDKRSRDQFITVEGREVMDRELLDQIGKSIKDAGNNPTQIQMQVFQQAQAHINRIVFLVEAKRQGFEPTLNALSLSLKEKFEQSKKAYEMQTKSKYPYTFYTFLEISKDNYMLNVLANNLNTPNFVDDLSIRREYSLKNTKTQIEYIAVKFSDFLKNVTVSQEKMNEAYGKEKDLFLESATIKVKTYKTQEEATADLKKLKTNKDYQQTSFQKIAPKMIKAGQIDEFFKIKAAGDKGITDIFQLNKSISIAQVVTLNYTPINKLKTEDFSRIKETALAKEREKFFKEFRDSAKIQLDKVTGPFEAAAKTSKLVYGKTMPISILKDSPVKEDKTEKPIELFAPENQEFFKNAFSKEGTISPVLEWGDYVYKIKVVGITKPVFPISEKDKEDIKKSLRDREQKLLYGDGIMAIRSKYDVKYNWKSINRLFGIKE